MGVISRVTVVMTHIRGLTYNTTYKLLLNLQVIRNQKSGSGFKAHKHKLLGGISLPYWLTQREVSGISQPFPMFGFGALLCRNVMVRIVGYSPNRSTENDDRRDG